VVVYYIHFVNKFYFNVYIHLCLGFLLHDLLDTLVESDGDLGLGDAESGLWRDVDGTVGADWRVLAAETSDAQVVWLQDGDGLLVTAALREVWDLDVDGRSHAGTHVGWARGDDTKVLGLGASAWDEVLDLVDGSLQSVEDVVDLEALLHGHDSKVILLTNPDDEALVLRHVAASAVWPVGGDTGINQEGVGAHVLEHDVGLDELLVLGLVDVVLVAWGKAVVLAAKVWVSAESIEHWAHSELHVLSVLLAHGTGEWEFLQVSGGSNSHGEWLLDAESGDIENTVGWEAFLALELPIVRVFLLVEVDLVVSAESLLEEIIEVIVIGWAHGVAAHLGAWVTNTGSHNLQESGLVGFVHAVESGFIEGGDGDVAWVGLLDGHDFLDGISVKIHVVLFFHIRNLAVVLILPVHIFINEFG